MLTDGRPRREAIGRFLFGAVFAVPGLLIVGIGTRTIQVDPSSVHGPYWLIGMIGGMFTVVGVWLASRGTRLEAVFKPVIGPVVLVCLLTALHWVAFGPGVRQCTGSVSLLFFSDSGQAGDLECRLAFGYGAVLFDGLFLSVGLSHFAKKRLTGVALSLTEKAGSAVLLLAIAPLLPVILVAIAVQAGTRWIKSMVSTSS
jgi:hypothetical protein